MRGRREPAWELAWMAGAGLALGLGLGGCFEPGNGAPADGTADAGETRAGAGGVGGSRSGGAGGAPIGTSPDASVFPPPPFDADEQLSGEQLGCLGLDQPVCLSCHTDPTTGQRVLRPTFAPPQPPDIVFTSEELAACGISVDGGGATPPDDDAGR